MVETRLYCCSAIEYLLFFWFLKESQWHLNRNIGLFKVESTDFFPHKAPIPEGQSERKKFLAT